MKCKICGYDPYQSNSTSIKENRCIDCAIPQLKRARESALESLEIEHWRKTGDFTTGNEILRNILRF